MTDPYVTDLPTTAGPIAAVIPLPPSAGRNALDKETIDLRIELGRAYIGRDEVRRLRTGSVVPLDSAVGDLVELYAGGRLIARGETIVLDGNLGVRVADVISRAGGN